MAAVLECVSVPRASVSLAFSPVKLSPSSVSLAFSPVKLSPSSVSSISARRRLSEFKGLRVFPTRSFGSVSYSQSSSLKFGRGGRIICEAQETAVDVPAVSDSTWQSLVLESELPVLVEFWAPWCGPCRMIHPIIDELSKQYAGKLKCYKVNTDESPSIATRYGIRSIPTVIIFKNGDKKDTVIGAVPKSTLTTSIEKFL